MKVLLFHIGRGGRFNNQGHITFIEIGGISQAPIIQNQDYYYPFIGYDKDGNYLEDYSDDAELLDEVGNGLRLTAKELRDDEGFIDIDGEYDSWYTAHSDELNQREAMAVLEYYKQHETRIYKEDLELLVEIAETTDIEDKIAEFLLSAWYFKSTCDDIKADANKWLGEHDYALIET